MIKLEAELSRNFWWTIGIVGGLFLFILAFVLLTNSFINENRREISEVENALVEFEVMTLETAYYFENKVQSAELLDEEFLGERWNLLWQRWDNISSVFSADQKRKLEKTLSSIELNQWQASEFSKYNLANRSSHLFDAMLVPSSTKLFDLSTELVNELRHQNDVAKLAEAADLRGYITNATKILSLIEQNGSQLLWQDFDKSLNKSVAALIQLTARSTTPSTDKLMLSLEKELARLRHNSSNYKYMLNRADFYALDTLVNKNYLLSSSLTKEMELSLKVYKESHIEKEKRWLTLFLALTLAVLALSAFFVRYLIKVRKKLSTNITEPIEQLVSNTDSVASGNLSHLKGSNTHLVEVDELSNAISKIASQVLENKRNVERQLHQQLLFDKLNELAIENETLDVFSEKAIVEIVNAYSASSAALFAISVNSLEKNPVLKASFNLPESLKSAYSKEINGLPLEVFRNIEQKMVDVSDKKLTVTSATIEHELCTSVIAPIISGAQCIGVLELLFVGAFDRTEEVYALGERLGILIKTLLSEEEARLLLIKTQLQKDKLDQSTAELEAQAQSLQQSETELEMQAEELKATNEEIRFQQNQTLLQKEELQKINSELASTAEKLEEANRQKTTFLAKVNHELKSPLNSILMLAQTILYQHDKTDSKVHESMKVIFQSGQELLDLINDLVDLAKIETNEVKTHIEYFSVKPIVDILFEQFKPISESSGIGWSAIVDNKTVDKIESDAQRLAQILKNFLSNAFKFCKSGEVSLKVSSDDSFIYFSVTDSGIGIPDDQKALIFESFKQVDDGSKRAYGGTGLGLSIASQLCELLHGEISLSDNEPQGTCFTLKLPIEFQGKRNRITDASYQEQTEAFKVNNYVLCANVDQCPAELLALNEFKNPANIVSYNELHSHSISDLQLIIFYFKDESLFEGRDAEQLQREFAKLQQNAIVILIVESSLPNELKWIEGAAYSVLKWNDTALKRLLELFKQLSSSTKRDEDSLQKKSNSDKSTAKNLNPSTGSNHKDKPNDFDDDILGSLAATSTVSQEGESQDFCVLLVDDDMRNLFSLSLALKGYGYETVLADSVNLAKEKLDSYPIDLIVTDITMPKEDGYDLIQYVQSQPSFVDLGVIVLSAKGTDEDREKCRALGCVEFFDKPVKIKELYEAISEVQKAKK
ncbi:hybrid sensor histidine kinase/response regulator [Aliikangiella sp. IMCC44632]